MLEELLQRINDNYDGNEDGVVSATTLLKPVQQTILKKRYKGMFRELNRDKANIGTIIHQGLEYFMNSSNLIQERRLYGDVKGHRISGKFDYYDLHRNVLGDIKSTSTYVYKRGDFEAI